MTFMRMLTGACLTAGLIHATSVGEAGFYMLIAAGVWACIADPLPAAVDRGLEAFKNRYQR